MAEKKILVIGGSYFLGRWFVQHAYKKHEVTVLNRGNIKIGLEGVREIVADRHDDKMLCKLKEDAVRYDAVVDFCAYEEGDISRIFKHLKEFPPERYIFVSTVDVYKKGTGGVLDEGAELADAAGTLGNGVHAESPELADEGAFADEPDPEAGYIRGKIKLEHELISECEKPGIKGVSVRPAILYGPGNYAPRESLYFEWIKSAGQIIHPAGSDGFFQMMYVSDAALGILKLCGLDADELKGAYNFCSDEILTYDDFEAALDEACLRYDPSLSQGHAFTKLDVSVETVLSQGIPLPFPLMKAESEKYSSALFESLGVETTPLSDGLFKCLKTI